MAGVVDLDRFRAVDEVDRPFNPSCRFVAHSRLLKSAAADSNRWRAHPSKPKSWDLLDALPSGLEPLNPLQVPLT